MLLVCFVCAVVCGLNINAVIEKGAWFSCFVCLLFDYLHLLAWFCFLPFDIWNVHLMFN